MISCSFKSVPSIYPKTFSPLIIFFLLNNAFKKSLSQSSHLHKCLFDFTLNF